MIKRILTNFRPVAKTISFLIAGITIFILIYSTREITPDTYGSSQERQKINFIKELLDSRKRAASFNDVKLFDFSASDGASSFAKDAIILTLDRNELTKILHERQSDIVFQVPVSGNGSMELELTRVTVTTGGFKVKSMSGAVIENPEEGLYYRGIVRGRPESFASVSMNDDFVSGIIAVKEGNLVIGPIGGRSSANNNYVLYNDAELLVKNNFKCGATDDSRFVLNRNRPSSRHGNRDNMTADTVRIYFVADYQMYLDNGSSVEATKLFIQSMFAHSATLYRNESIPVGISGIGVFDFADPYRTYNQSDQVLYAFGANTQDNFNGDLAHLLSTRPGNMGGIAWINVLCQSYNPGDRSGRFAFSNIENDYSPYPLYSWTVFVVTHETGHNLGSQHTHACVWPVLQFGGIGAIDSCVQAEGTCFLFPQPNQNGTIMSYCHLNGAISFQRGFGPLPGDTIQRGYALAVCLDSALNSSEVPLTFSLSQNYPNPFNPATTIRFSIPEGGYVTLKIVDITGRQIAAPIDNGFYPEGIYSYVFNSSSHTMASGVYFYKIDVKSTAREYSESKKMVMLK